MAHKRGSVYAKGRWLYLSWYDEQGKRRLQATGLPVGQEAQAEERLRALQRLVKTRAEVTTDGALTVRVWGERWLQERKARKLASEPDDRSRLELYIYPHLGDKLLEDVRVRDVRVMVAAIAKRKSRKGGLLAPRSVLNAYGVLRAMMADAVADEVIATSPCQLRAKDLPQKADKDPEWRSKAVFTRGEVEKLISADQIPLDRRVMYALLALAGLRWGEAASLQWRDYDQALQPLGRLVIAKSYSTRRKTVGPTKTGTTRLVPVHPTLAKILAQWKLASPPSGPDALLCPSRLGRPRSSTHGLHRFLEDLERIGVRARRLHDLRRTFTSLTRSAGAPKDLVSWITHAPRTADVIDGYTELEWKALCGVVAAARVGLLEGQVIALPMAVGAEAATRLLPEESAKEKPRKSLDLRGFQVAGCTGLENVPKGGEEHESNGETRVKSTTWQPGSGNEQESPEVPSSKVAIARIRSSIAGLPPSDARAILLQILAELG